MTELLRRVASQRGIPERIQRWAWERFLRRRRPRDWLDGRTGMTSTAWVRWIQEEIQATWRDNPADAAHPISRPVKDWLGPLLIEVERRMRYFAGRHGDENIGLAQTVAVILAWWSIRVHRAKTQDPHRPIRLRQESYRAWLSSAAALVEPLLNEAYDPQMFEQAWETPYAADATDGDFI